MEGDFVVEILEDPDIDIVIDKVALVDVKGDTLKDPELQYVPVNEALGVEESEGE